MAYTMKVTKRDGRLQAAHFDKITARIEKLAVDLHVDAAVIAQQTIKSMCDKISTSMLDIIAANCAESMAIIHNDYSVLAARIAISNNHKSTPQTFSECCELQKKYDWFLDEAAFEFVMEHRDELDAMVVSDRDYRFSYSGFKTLQQGYLRTNEPPPWVHDLDENADEAKQTKGDVIDRPQYMYMRNAIAKWRAITTIEKAMRLIKEDYDALSTHKFTHGTPAMMNACESGCLASCFLFGCADDTTKIGEYSTKLMLVSKSGGGVGSFFHDVRPAKSRIRTSRGVSSGLCPQIELHDKILKTFDQGGGKRKGSGAMFLEMWHADVANVFQMKRASGGSYRAQSLFYSAWIPDLFMKRLITGDSWSLMGSDTAPGLAHVFDGMDVCARCRWCSNPSYAKYIEPPADGWSVCRHVWEEVDAFTALYTRYERENRARKVIKPISLVKVINETRRETGVPYICFKDHVNRQSNQKNIGTIQSSNLCTEIMQWATTDSVATCILASINLTLCVKVVDGVNTVDYDAIESATRRAVRDCDRMVDINKYPLEECKGNARDTRAIGVGCQGLANLFALCGVGWDSPEAEKIDYMIHETMYFSALQESADLAEELGAYPLFEGSPASRGILRFDLWVNTRRRMGLTGDDLIPPLSGRYNVGAIKERIQKVGLRNSLLLALMPTQTSSLTLGNNECFEPFFALFLSRGVIGGERPEFNKLFIADCVKRGIWNEKLRTEIIEAGGITSRVASLPADLKVIYKVWIDISQRYIVQRAAKRAAFIDQSQSLNLLFANNSDVVLQSSMVEAWRQGLPTGTYYTRTNAATEALKTGVSASCQDTPVVSAVSVVSVASLPSPKVAIPVKVEPIESGPVCVLVNGRPVEGCDWCSS